MVASCCRFLCYFCRISRQNQKAMFEHLSYLLENSSVGLGTRVGTCTCGLGGTLPADHLLRGEEERRRMHSLGVLSLIQKDPCLVGKQVK